jgi:hypothetical protein
MSFNVLIRNSIRAEDLVCSAQQPSNVRMGVQYQPFRCKTRELLKKLP